MDIGEFGILALILLISSLGVILYFVIPKREEESEELFEVMVLDWAQLATGKSGWLQIEQDWLRAMQEVYALFCEKQKDYGPTNIGTGGEQGVALRSGDKVSRLFELLGVGTRKEGVEASNEPRRDSWMDMADYGIIGMLVHDGKWPKMYPGDVWGGEAAYLLLKETIAQNPSIRQQLLSELIEYELAFEIAGDLAGEVNINEDGDNDFKELR